jgi:hypothetical protein
MTFMTHLHETIEGTPCHYREFWNLCVSSFTPGLSFSIGAFLACLRPHHVIGVDRQRIRVVTRTGARMSIYRPEGGGVLAWEVRAAE